VKRLSAVIAAAAALVLSAPAWAGPNLFVGFDDDRPRSLGADGVTPARDLGARAMRLTLMWSPGQTSLPASDVDQLDRATAALTGMRIVLSVYADSGAKAPVDATARDQYCTYIRTVLTRYPAINDVVLWNEPNTSFFWRPQYDASGASAAPAAYEALAARCYDVLHAFRPTVNLIGPALSPRGNDNPGAASNVSHSPGEFIRRLGIAYRASARAQPLFDTIGHHGHPTVPGERPWRQHIGSKTIGLGDWNKLMSNLATAFDGTAQAIPGQCVAGHCVSLWYLEVGYETRPDDPSLYTGTEVVGGVLPDDVGGEPDAPAPSAESLAPDQSTQIRDSVRLAYCQPYVDAYFNFLLFDDPSLASWQSGAFWADRTPKGSLGAFRQAIGEANADTVDCGALKGGRPSADYTPPSAPAGLVATTATPPLKVTLNWSPSADPSGIAGYRVYRNGAFYAWAPGTTSYADTAVKSFTTYAYTVYAQDAAGNLSAVSNRVSVTTPDGVPPTAPTNVRVVAATRTSVTVSWTGSTDNVGVAGYLVATDGAWTVVGATARSATLSGLACARPYTVYVLPVDAAGNWSWAAAAGVTAACG
jgi:chitodextrinase